MRTLKKDLKERLKNKAFKKAYKAERKKLEEEKIWIEFGLKLKQYRLKKSMTQQQLAEKAQVTQQQLSNIEAGANVTMQTYIRVCDALKIPLTIGAPQRKRLTA
jgi:DNA-binding XRE family transcriptional regulator